MANYTAVVNKALQSQERYMKVTESEVNTGDVIRVLDSLGRVADTITIEADALSDLSIKINSRVVVYKPRQYPEQNPFNWEKAPEVKEQTEFETGVDSLTVGNTTSAVTYQLNDIPIRDIEVTYTAGSFEIILS